MRYVCIIFGFLTGKTKVKCVECKHLDAAGIFYLRLTF